jgi:hypothetical protein
MSTELPAASGATIVIGRDGQGAWACARAAAFAAAAEQAASSAARRRMLIDPRG